jgi:hypothetical protein
MTRLIHKLIAAAVIVPCCAVAGCGTYGPHVAQGSKSDTALDAGIGQEFQKLVPRGTAVRDVRCFPSTNPGGGGRGDCRITMIANKPDPGYTYRVVARRTRFVAEAASADVTDAWIPPQFFSGGY